MDFLLRAKRDVGAAKAFFRRAFARHGRPPRKITLDGYQASHRAAPAMRRSRSPASNSCIASGRVNSR
ncbi:DDE-type integrase/transposase/recombinase [Methylosinus sp. H3A]|uniref:DDE-type integrase/transposase/recombinase n=1 Tax=Methylosinus sp. H3A TaxID=2785786 RepID=UPI003917561C